MNRKGFTLIELLIILTIIGILAAIAIPQFEQYRKTARMKQTYGDSYQPPQKNESTSYKFCPNCGKELK